MTQEALKKMYQLLLTEPHAPTVCAKLEAIAREALAQPEQEPVAWLLTDKNINSLQVDSIQRLIDRLNHAHHTDLRVRINGQDEWFQADWLKHMIRVTPPQRPWIGLTAEEVLQCWEKAHEPGNKEHINAIRMADEVEAKLKEKNCG